MNTQQICLEGSAGRISPGLGATLPTAGGAGWTERIRIGLVGDVITYWTALTDYIYTSKIMLLPSLRCSLPFNVARQPVWLEFSRAYGSCVFWVRPPVLTGASSVCASG